MLTSPVAVEQARTGVTNYLLRIGFVSAEKASYTSSLVA
jgi:hypothetical protein